MEDRVVYIREITGDIIDNYFPNVDRLSDLITPDPIRATRIIVNKIRRVIDKFEEYCPLTGSYRINVDGNGLYTFHDNYLDVVEERVPKEQLELIPMTVARVGGSNYAYFGNLATTANYWSYHAPVLKCYARGRDIQVDCVYHYPIYITYSEDNLINAESHIFGLDRKQRSMLMNIMELEFLKMIKGNADRIKLPYSVDFFNLQEDIQNLQSEVDEDIQSCSSAIIGWR